MVPFKLLYMYIFSINYYKLTSVILTNIIYIIYYPIRHTVSKKDLKIQVSFVLHLPFVKNTLPFLI